MSINCWVCLEPLRKKSGSQFSDCLNDFCGYRWTTEGCYILYRFGNRSFESLTALMEAVKYAG